MIKKTNKSTKSPAPATNTTAPKSRKKAAAVAAVPEPVVLAASPAPVAEPAAISPTASALVKAILTRPMVTTITARINVGYGNTLYLRGEGPGLRWDSGVAMNCVASDQWTITLPESARAYTFKFLINDTTWSAGPDFTAACGTSVTLTPTF